MGVELVVSAVVRTVEAEGWRRHLSEGDRLLGSCRCLEASGRLVLGGSGSGVDAGGRGR